MTTTVMAVLQAGAVPTAIHFSSTPILTAVERESTAAATDVADADDAIADGLAVQESIGAASHGDGNAAAADKPIHGSSSTHLHPQTTPTCQVTSGKVSHLACCLLVIQSPVLLAVVAQPALHA